MDWRGELAGIVLIGGGLLALAAWIGLDRRLKQIDAYAPRRMMGSSMGWLKWAVSGAVCAITLVIYGLLGPN